MQIGSVDHNISNQYVNKGEDRQTQPVNAADKTDDISKMESSATSGPPNGRHDEYVPSGDKSEQSAGVYKLKQDKDGKKKIEFDRTDSAKKNGGRPEVNSKPSAEPDSDKQPEGVDGSKRSNGKTESKCTANTDRVDREIKKLKKEKRRIEQELNSNRSDEDKCRELEQQLSQVESELSMKDNDAYRKQNAAYT